MKRLRTTLMALVGLLGVTSMTSLIACEASDPTDGTDPEGYGSMTLALLDGTTNWFRLTVFAEVLVNSAETKNVFDTGCVEATSRTYELTNIPVGDGMSVLLEGFDTSSCAPESRSEIGYRGDVSVVRNQRPYYHIPLYEDGVVTAFPEALNLSASVAEPINFCDSDTQCASVPKGICYDVSQPSYFCVPTCTADSDCVGIHPQSTCDQDAGWCMLFSPFPLNLSEPRALGEAVTLSDGSVVFIGGFGVLDDNGTLRSTRHLLEGFDPGTGLFVATEANGVSEWPAALFGLAEMGGDRFVMVGGVSELSLRWNVAQSQLVRAGTGPLMDTLVTLNPTEGTAVSSKLPRPLAQPVVLALSTTRLLVAGGLSDADGTATRDAYLCDVAGSGAVTCSGISPLTTPRRNAAASCLDTGCTEVLIVGGNSDGAVAELLTLSGDSGTFKALVVDGLTRAFDPVLCGTTMVSWSRQNGIADALAPLSLNVEGETLKIAPLSATIEAPYLAAVAYERAGSCWVAGGLTDGEATDRVLRATPNGATAIVSTLTSPRFGAAGAVVSAGPLASKVLFGGGLTVTNGALKLVRGVEVYSP
ncbi:MAG: hypothetical protein ACI9MR_004597 [Myxococcota bacterium]|jgi:hypothetical protein